MSNNPIQTNDKAKCFAKTRKNGLCKTQPVTGKKRCRMHGGAKGSGAPYGSQNAFKHGRYSKAIIENRKRTSSLKENGKSFCVKTSFN